MLGMMIRAAATFERSVEREYTRMSLADPVTRERHRDAAIGRHMIYLGEQARNGTLTDDMILDHKNQIDWFYNQGGWRQSA